MYCRLSHHQCCYASLHDCRTMGCHVRPVDKTCRGVCTFLPKFVPHTSTVTLQREFPRALCIWPAWQFPQEIWDSCVWPACPCTGRPTESEGDSSDLFKDPHQQHLCVKSLIAEIQVLETCTKQISAEDFNYATYTFVKGWGSEVAVIHSQTITTNNS